MLLREVGGDSLVFSQVEPESWKHREGFMQEMAQHWALGTGRIQRLAGEGSNLSVAAPGQPECRLRGGGWAAAMASLLEAPREESRGWGRTATS